MCAFTLVCSLQYVSCICFFFVTIRALALRPLAVIGRVNKPDWIFIIIIIITVLDLSFTNLQYVAVPRSYRDVVIPSLPLLIPISNVSLWHHSPSVNRPGICGYNIARRDYISLLYFLSETDWSHLDTLIDVDEMTDYFTGVLHDRLSRFVPRKTQKKSNYPSIWTKKGFGKKESSSHTSK